MSFSKEQLTNIRDDFHREYWDSEPWKEFVGSTAIKYRDNVPYLEVGLRQRLKHGLVLPESYQGLEIAVVFHGPVKKLNL